VGEIACQHCGDSVRTPRPDRRKWCDRCAALKGLLALGLTTQKCKVCEEDFFPPDQAHARAKVCAGCAGTPGVTRDSDPCVYCNGVTQLIPGVALCYPCAGSPDAKRHTHLLKQYRLKLKAVSS
jgi:hypothetical protein